MFTGKVLGYPRDHLSDGLDTRTHESQFAYPLGLDWSYESFGRLNTVKGRASLISMSMLGSRGEREMHDVKTRNATNDYLTTTIYN